MILLVIIVLSYKFFLIFFLFSLIFIVLTQLLHYKLKYQHSKNFKNIKTLSFVHPFCADCGGGEKVLWRMITSLIETNAINREHPIQKLKINIISGKLDNISDLIKKLKERFNIDLNEMNKNNLNFNNNSNSQSQINNKLVYEVELIPLRSGYMLRPQKFFTMLLQILGQIFFGFEIITKTYSDIYCDTTGLPFCYFILKYLGHAKVTSYTHYPFISNEMIYQVQYNISGVHSRGNLNKYKIIKNIKLYYYKLILLLYKFMGNKCLSFAYVNSTWTFNRMKALWSELFINKKLLILYPPCSISIYKEAAKNSRRQNIIVSFAQFRPEKRQDLQIKILAQLKDRLNNYPGFQDLELHIIGGVRNADDQNILDQLVEYSKELGVQNYVKFLPNGSIDQILEEFAKAKIGIHTMKEEHFGITLIEMMAAGLIMVTHNSAGAQDDILVKSENGEKPGILADSDDEYVTQIEELLIRYEEIKYQFINAASKRAEKFSDEAFKEQFISQLHLFLD